MADNVIRVNVTTAAPKSVTIQGSKEQNYINATGDTSAYNSQLAKNWAIGEGLIQNIDYSSKHYAGVAKEQAELAGENLNTVQNIVAEFSETASNAGNQLAEAKDNAISEINNLNTSVIEGIETANNEVIAEIEGAKSSAVTEVTTSKNNAISSIEAKGQEQIKNIEKTGFFMENDKLFFINSEGEVEEFSSGGGTLNMFDTVLKDHILTYKETKGLALQGTYVYKEAVAGERYGYPTFYDKCVEEYNNPNNTYEVLQNNYEVVGTPTITEYGVASGFSQNNGITTTINYLKCFKIRAKGVFSETPNTSPSGKPWSLLGVQGGIGIDIHTGMVGVVRATTNSAIYTSIKEGDVVEVELEQTEENITLKAWINGVLHEKTWASTAKEYTNSTLNIGAAGKNSTYYWTGSIDLTQFSIKVDGNEVYRAVDCIATNPNGHKFYPIHTKSLIDERYTSTGRAWFYGVDTENERIFLPRNNSYFRIGNESTVGTNQDAGLPNITGTFTSGAYGSSDYQASGAVLGSSAKGDNLGSGNYARTVDTFDASRCSKVYGNAVDTVELDSVNMLLYICVGNTESEEALTNVTEITTSENDTLPWGYHFYSGELLEAPIGYIESLGQWNDGSGLYAQFYSKAVNKLGEAFAGGYIKEVTEEYDDYDLVINQTDMTFRLPLLDGSESLSGNGEYIPYTITTSGSEYTANKNGEVVFSWRVANDQAFINLVNVTSGVEVNSLASGTQRNLRLVLSVKKGDIFRIKYDATGGDTSNNYLRLCPAIGNGSLYFKVANAVQNLELLNAGEVLEAVQKIGAKPHIIETYQNGSSWYRVYSDGWCEQGGISLEITQSLTFLKTFATIPNLIATKYTSRTDSSGSYAVRVLNLTPQGCTIRYDSYTADVNGYCGAWQACGYIA